MPQSHLRRDWAHDCHICTGTGPTPCHICAGTASGRPCRFIFYYNVLFLVGFNNTYAHFIYTDWNPLLLVVINVPYIYAISHVHVELMIHLVLLSSVEEMKDNALLAEQRVRRRNAPKCHAPAAACRKMPQRVVADRLLLQRGAGRGDVAALCHSRG